MFFSMNYAGNEKTGPIPVTSSSRDTCPDCALAGICYGEDHHSGRQWTRLDAGQMKSGGDWASLIYKVKQLPRFQLWRHNEKGDLPHTRGQIDKAKLKELTRANKARHGFTYTHHERTPENVEAIKQATSAGFTINASCNTPAEAVEAYKLGLATVAIVPSDSPPKFKKEGVLFKICPNQLDKKIKCSICALCQDATRRHVVAFLPHGTRRRKVDIIARG